jgi:Tfp pilus assembly protein PilN
MRAVNLIPADQRGDAGGGGGRSGGGVYVVLGLLGGLAVMALLYGLAAHESSSRRSDVATLTAEVAQAQVRAAQLAPYTSFLAMREQRVQAVSQLVDSRFDWAHVFHELGRVLPPNKVSLTSLEGTVGPGSGSGATPGAATSAGAGASTTAAAKGSSGSSVASATPPGSVPTFTLTGCATSQAEVALMLDRLRLIEGVKEVSLQSSTQSSAKSSSSAGGSGSGGCAGGQPAFSAQVVFVALPNVTNSASGSSGSTATVALSAGGVASTPSTGASR